MQHDQDRPEDTPETPDTPDTEETRDESPEESSPEPEAEPDAAEPAEAEETEGAEAKVEADAETPTESVESPATEDAAEPEAAEETPEAAEPEAAPETEDPAEPEAPAETEGAAETEAPAETEGATETEAPAQTEDAAETEAPAQTEEPAETEAPAETEEPAETEAQADATGIEDAGAQADPAEASGEESAGEEEAEPPPDDTDDEADPALDEDAKKSRAQQRQENLKTLQGLAERLERLMEAAQVNLKRTERSLREAAQALKSPPALPSKKEWPTFKRRLEAAREALMPKVRELEELEEWKRWANVPKQEELAKRLEDLAESKDMPLVTREFRSTMEEWKKVATAPREKAEELWERFKAAREALREKVDAHLAQQAEERKENLKKKIALCEKAEALQDSTDWRETADALKALQAEWKKLGPVPRKHSNAVWKRFRGACDVFFERRKKDLDSRREVWDENLKKKIALCEKAEAMQDSTDWEAGTQRFKALQAEWKAVGPVPRKHSNSIWKRFRSACDRFFDRRSRKDELPLEANVEVREKLLADLAALLPQDEAQDDAEAKAEDAAEEPAKTEPQDEASEESAETPEGAEAEGEEAAPAAEPAEAEETEEAPAGPPENLAERIGEIRQAWRTAGGVPRGRYPELVQRFSDLSEALQAAYPEELQGTDLDPKVIADQRLKLVERMESLVQEVRPEEEDSEPASIQDLAAQLKQALAANTIRRGAAFNPVNWREISSKAEAVKRGWRELPGEADKKLAARFDQAVTELGSLRPKDR